MSMNEILNKLPNGGGVIATESPEACRRLRNSLYCYFYRNWHKGKVPYRFKIRGNELNILPKSFLVIKGEK